MPASCQPRQLPAPRSRLLVRVVAVASQLVKLYQNDPEVLVRRSVEPEEYVDRILQAKFCPVCGGFSQWTPRLAEALYYECARPAPPQPPPPHAPLPSAAPPRPPPHFTPPPHFHTPPPPFTPPASPSSRARASPVDACPSSSRR